MLIASLAEDDIDLQNDAEWTSLARNWKVASTKICRDMPWQQERGTVRDSWISMAGASLQ